MTYCGSFPLFPYFACLHKPISIKKKFLRISERTDTVRGKRY